MKQVELTAKGEKMTDGEVYIDLTDKNFRTEVLESEQVALVKFGAEWLGSCSIMAPILEKLNARFGQQIKFCRVDVDRNSRLTDMYNITYLPTFIFLKSGQVVDQIVGLAPEEVFLAKINALLEAYDDGQSGPPGK